jgi:hypothetical protein
MARSLGPVFSRPADSGRRGGEAVRLLASGVLYGVAAGLADRSGDGLAAVGTDSERRENPVECLPAIGTLAYHRRRATASI